MPTAVHRRARGAWESVRHPVVALGLGLVALQLLLRAWALYPSWFFTDDYRLMLAAHDSPLSWAYITEPFDSQFMPFGRLVVWLVTSSGTLNWGLAASITLILQGTASFACLWMLCSVFGRRWSVLPLLMLYLTSCITMPALMWWAAAVNQIPLQAAFFVAVGAWVRYLRDRRPVHLVVTLIAVACGLLCYVKALLIFPVLLTVAVGYFAQGRAGERFAHVLKTFRVAACLGIILAGTFAVFYVTQVPQPFEDASDSKAAEVADSMLGTSLSSGLLGGPWTWWRTSPPIVLADPPNWSVHLAWVVIAMVVVYSILIRRGTLAAWGLLWGYALVLYALLATSRGQLFGRLAGLEYRYLTDIVPVFVLVIGLVFLRVPGAVGSSAMRVPPILTLRLPRYFAGALVAAVCLGGLGSSIRYVDYWHHDNAGRTYVQNLNRSLDALENQPELVPQTLPAEVMPEYTKPTNTSPVFLQLLGRSVTFPTVMSEPMMIDPSGEVRPAVVRAGLKSLPGPIDGCGWKVKSSGRTIPLKGNAFAWPWFVRIGYLASEDADVTITAGDSSIDASVSEGLGNLFVRVTDEFDDVEISGLPDGATMCIDTIEVGDPAPLPAN